MEAVDCDSDLETASVHYLTSDTYSYLSKSENKKQE